MSVWNFIENSDFESIIWSLKHFVICSQVQSTSIAMHLIFHAQLFLSSYRRLLVATARARGAPATGGMAANMITGVTGAKEVEEAVIRDKRREIESGVDGFLIYDLALVAPCR